MATERGREFADLGAGLPAIGGLPAEFYDAIGQNENPSQVLGYNDFGIMWYPGSGWQKSGYSTSDGTLAFFASPEQALAAFAATVGHYGVSYDGDVGTFLDGLIGHGYAGQGGATWKQQIMTRLGLTGGGTGATTTAGAATGSGLPRPPALAVSVTCVRPVNPLDWPGYAFCVGLQLARQAGFIVAGAALMLVGVIFLFRDKDAPGAEATKALTDRAIKVGTAAATDA